MLHTIVEGEPGIFPDPVARVMRKIGGWFDRRTPAHPGTDTPPDDPPSSPSRPEAEAQPQTDAERAGDDDPRSDDRSDGSS